MSNQAQEVRALVIVAVGRLVLQLVAGHALSLSTSFGLGLADSDRSTGAIVNHGALDSAVRIGSAGVSYILAGPQETGSSPLIAVVGSEAGAGADDAFCASEASPGSGAVGVTGTLSTF